MTQQGKTPAAADSRTRTASPYPTRRVLFVLTSHGTLGRDGGEPTGFHLFEAARPWIVLRAAGHEIDFASPRGGAAPIDPGSLDRDDPDNAAFLDDADASNKLRSTEPLERVCASDYACVYFPGGHGAMWDFPDNPHIQRIAADVFERGGVVGAICHGPAALVNARNNEGRYLVEGRRVAAFTDEEERAVHRDAIVPFLLASKLKERGAAHVKAENFAPCVCTDGRLVTGQNPASAPALAEALRAAIADCAALSEVAVRRHH